MRAEQRAAQVAVAAVHGAGQRESAQRGGPGVEVELPQRRGVEGAECAPQPPDRASAQALGDGQGVARRHQRRGSAERGGDERFRAARERVGRERREGRAADPVSRARPGRLHVGDRRIGAVAARSPLSPGQCLRPVVRDGEDRGAHRFPGLGREPLARDREAERLGRCGSLARRRRAQRTEQGHATSRFAHTAARAQQSLQVAHGRRPQRLRAQHRAEFRLGRFLRVG